MGKKRYLKAIIKGNEELKYAFKSSGFLHNRSIEMTFIKFK